MRGSGVRASVVFAWLIAFGVQGHAQGLGEPSVPTNGAVILDLSGYSTATTPDTAAISTYNTDIASPGFGTCLGGNGSCIATTYRAHFVVPSDVSGLTTLTFAFRNDSGFFGFSDVAVTLAGSRTNQLADGKFAAGAVAISTDSLASTDASQCAIGSWCGFNQVPGIAAGTLVSNPDTAQPNGTGLSWARNDGSGYFWVDGATQQYDGLYQNVQLTPGATYNVRFVLEDITLNTSVYDTGVNGLADSCGGMADYTTYQALSSNGDSPSTDPTLGDACGNAANVVVYVGFPGLPTPLIATPDLPEPGSLAVFATGLLGMAGTWRRRRPAG